MSAETLRQVFVRASAGSCAAGVLATLVPLAYDGDFEASRALVRILAHELDYDSDSEGFVRAGSIPELIAACDVPALLRVYLLGLTPRAFFENLQTARMLSPGIQSERDLQAFQRLVMRDAPTRHEVLKAYVLGTFANFTDLMSRIGGGGPPSGGMLRTLDTILENCQVVPGDNATSDFEFGRDLLTNSTTTSLSFVIGHELGHHAFRMGAAGANADTIPFDLLMREVANALPKLLENALQRPGTSVQPGDRRGFKASSGLSLLCTNERKEHGSYVHLSITQAGGPIELARAGQLACAILDLLGIDREFAAVAYSRRGVFHFGFSGNPPSVKRARDRVRSLRPGEWTDIGERSTQWLDGLKCAGRMFRSEFDIPVALGVAGPMARFHGLNPYAAAEHAMCHEETAGGVSAGDLNNRFRAAIRCADPVAARRFLALGASSMVPLREIGMDIFAISDARGVQYFGPTAEGVFDILDMLHAANVNLDAPLDDTGHTLLTEAAYGSLDLVRLLVASGCDVNRAGAGGKTPISIAIAFGRYEPFEELLNAGAQPQIADDDGNTPLHEAVMRGEERMARSLMESSVNPDATNRHGMTPLMMARSPALVDLLVHAGADIDFAIYGGLTALMFAARMRQLDIVRCLLEHGADTEAATDRGETALHFAASIFDARVRLGCLDALLQAGADVNEETNEGVTPLMIAAATVAEDAVALLIRAGANVNTADQEGNSPLLKVLRSGRAELTAVVSLLLQAGASVSHANTAGETGLALAAGAGIPAAVREMIEKQASQENQR